jgi:hypothetical protein
MIPTGHLLIGGAVGATLAVHLPGAVAAPLALGLGVASHHLLDLLPHTDAGTFYPDDGPPPPRRVCLVVGLEGLLGLLLTVFLYLAHYPTWPFLLGAIGGMVPDLLDNIPLWQKRFRATRFGAFFHQFHMAAHCTGMEQRWLFGLGVDALVVVGGLWYLLA